MDKFYGWRVKPIQTQMLASGSCANRMAIYPKEYFCISEEINMQWNKPTYQISRFGFEVTMYISNR